VPLLVVGRGSNMLVADAGWPGIALHLGQRFRRIEVEGTELEAGAATPLPSVAAHSAKASLGGIAFAVAIPGSVGGGVRMNAGAHGGELADRLVWADVFHLTGEPPIHRGAGLEPPGPPGGRAVRMKPDELGFGYRRSALPPGAVVTAARFALVPAPEATVRAEIDEARRWRRDNQPVNQPNCGSVFANPPEMAAGRVVELLGMKGETVGGARVSEVHANFIVAADGATAADVLTLIRRAMRRARDELGIILRTEVQLVGDFGRDELGATPAGPAGSGPAGPDHGEGVA
jgi:UDP-N-acetylmuramate dehydrogenase